MEDVRKIIEMYLETLPKNSKKEAGFFGGSFTGISLKLQKEYLETVYEYIKKGLIDGIRLSTRPDCINREIVEQLKKSMGRHSVELGVQCLDEKVLSSSENIIQSKVVAEACKLLKVWNRARNST